jgi:hypothetical protein
MKNELRKHASFHGLFKITNSNYKITNKSQISSIKFQTPRQRLVGFHIPYANALNYFDSPVLMKISFQFVCLSSRSKGLEF